MPAGGTAAALTPFVGMRARGAQARQLGAPQRPIPFTDLRLFDSTDILFTPQVLPRQGAMLAKLRGVIASGALADMLVAEGDPGRSLDFLIDPEENLRLIMKDGRIHKDRLQ